MGVVGVISDGGIRGILELRTLGLHCFASGLVSSHGNPRLIEVNLPVETNGLIIAPGDLLHGKTNGVTTVPLEIAAKISAAAARLRENEADLMGYMKSPGFTVDGLYRRKFTH